MPKIKVIVIPPGEAREEIRKEWVEAKTPLLPDQSAATYYKVDIDEAICALVEKGTKGGRVAAQYWIHWRENTVEGRDAEFFVFPKSMCELIE